MCFEIAPLVPVVRSGALQRVAIIYLLVLLQAVAKRNTYFHTQGDGCSSRARGVRSDGWPLQGPGVAWLLCFLLGYRAARDGDDVVLYGGDRAFHPRPHADGEALVNGLSYLLLVRHLVALGDERCGRVQQTAAQGQAHARDLADQRDDAFFGGICLYAGVLFALPAPGE